MPRDRFGICELNNNLSVKCEFWMLAIGTWQSTFFLSSLVSRSWPHDDDVETEIVATDRRIIIIIVIHTRIIAIHGRFFHRFHENQNNNESMLRCINTYYACNNVFYDFHKSRVDRLWRKNLWKSGGVDFSPYLLTWNAILSLTLDKSRYSARHG